MTQAENGRFSQMSDELLPVQFTPSALLSATSPAGREAKDSDTADPGAGLPHRKSIEALAIHERLDQVYDYVKLVESMVDEARKALAEGRELPPGLLNLPAPSSVAGLPLPAHLSSATHTVGSKDLDPRDGTIEPVADVTASALEKEEDVQVSNDKNFGVTPDKAIPAHLRTSSTQVEPATPPKWMTYAEAEEKVKQANAWVEAKSQSQPGSRPVSGAEMKRISGKRERGSGKSYSEPIG